MGDRSTRRDTVPVLLATDADGVARGLVAIGVDPQHPPTHRQGNAVERGVSEAADGLGVKHPVPLDIPIQHDLGPWRRGVQGQGTGADLPVCVLTAIVVAKLRGVVLGDGAVSVVLCVGLLSAVVRGEGGHRLGQLGGMGEGGLEELNALVPGDFGLGGVLEGGILCGPPGAFCRHRIRGLHPGQ